nr:prophage MuMc02 [uncultured Mediterranean phage uvMED]
MPTNIKDYSTTQASNTSLNGISTAEGMLPSNLNNAIRALMKNTRDWFNDAQWIEYGDGDGAFTAAYASATSFTIAGVDVTSIYHAGRRIKLTATTPGTIFGTIASSSFSTNTTVNVTWDSGSLANEAITHVYIGALSKTNSSIPTEIIGTSNISDSAITTAKIAADAVNGTKIADDSINSEHYVDGSIDTAHIADAQITTAKITDANVTTAKIAADAVDGTKIADDSINSEHYVDGSIDTAHIADSQITTAKIADSAITSAKINDGAIVNADINASAAIDATKIHDGTISNTEFGYLNGVSSNIQDQLDAKGASNANLTAIGNLATTDGNFIVGSGSTWVAETGSTARASLGLGTISTQASSSVAITGGTITGLGSPSSGSDAATKTYVDNLVTGLKTRIITRVATTTNINLSNALENGDTLDGITLATGNKVLVKDQTDATENGIYNVVASGTATRDTDYDTVAELAGQLVIVQEGSSNADKIFLCTTDNSGSIGSVNIVFTVVTPSNVGDVTLNGVQTLTNKTLTSPVISDIVSVSNGNISVSPNGTGKVLLDGDGSSGGVAVTDGLVEIKTGTGSVAKVKFYCESSNAHAQTLQAAPHSAASSAVLTLPNNTGTLIGTGDSGTLPVAAIDIDGGTDIGADLTTSDLIIVDDGAGGTNRKAALSRIVTLVDANSSAASAGFAVAMAIAL